MKGLKYHFKILLKDKMIIISFVLPIIMALSVNVITEDTFLSVESINFIVFEKELNDNVVEKLENYGIVETVSSKKQIEKKILEPSSDFIGLILTNDDPVIIISGDETTYIKAIARNIVNMINLETRNKLHKKINNKTSDFIEKKQLFVGIVMLVSLFIGCSFNAINIVSENESGISAVNLIIPINKLHFVIQKITIGFIGNIVISLLTWITLKGISIYLIRILLLIILASYFSAVLGLFIAQFGKNFIGVIVFIKFTLILFIATPILSLLLNNNSMLYKILYLTIPSLPVFNILNTLDESLMVYIKDIIIILFHCITWTYFYSFFFYKKQRS